MSAKKKPMAPSPATKNRKPAAKGLAPEARAMVAEMQRGVKHLEISMREIQTGLRKAERKLEADARARARELRKAATNQLSVLKAKQREASDTLDRMSSAASGSWTDIKRMGQSVLVDVRATAATAVERFREALGG